MSDTIETLQAEPTPPSGELVEDAIITTHRILEAFGRDARTFDILHADLYDSRQGIVLSALQAVAAIADGRSFLYVARLFQHPDQQVVSAAVRAAGAIGGPEAPRLLHSLAMQSRVEEVSLEALRVLARHFPEAPETRLLAVALSRSLSVQPETVTASLEVLLQLESSKGAQSVLDMAAQHSAVLPSLFQLAGQDKNLADALLAAQRKTHGDLPLPLRSALVSLASPLTSEAHSAVFFDSLRSMNPAIRRECYRDIGIHASQLPHFDTLCALLAENVEDDPSMEEEALQAVDSMASIARAEPSTPALPSLSRLTAAIEKSYDDLRKALETDIDTSHEIGQQLASAKEYMELYFSERAKKTFIDSIRSGGTPCLRREGVQVLKASAVKLEPRHFRRILDHVFVDRGPRSLRALPCFSGDLTYADTQKRKVMSRLKRLLSLARLSPPADAKDEVLSILEWARKMKFFHLAELALLALHRIDPESALILCRESMTPPVAAKILAIAALQLVGEMDIKAMETIFISLLHENDRYIRLALLESLGSVEMPGESNLMRSILQLLCAETDPEVASKLVEILGSQAETGIAGALIAVYDRFDEWKKTLAITLLCRLARKCDTETRPALTEFFYRVLRVDRLGVAARVPAGLLALGDDYAPNVLRDLLVRMGPAEQSIVVRDLRGDLKPAVIAVIWSLLREKDAGLQQALREVLPMTADPRAQQLLVSMVRTLRTKASDTETQEGQADRVFHLSSEKATYRFEREKTLTCAVMFSRHPELLDQGSGVFLARARMPCCRSTKGSSFPSWEPTMGRWSRGWEMGTCSFFVNGFPRFWRPFASRKPCDVITASMRRCSVSR